MTSKVEEFFITPMEAHFEAVPKDGPRETILHDLEPYAAEDLMEAAEWLKRARQAQSTFPSPRECIKAIKAVTGGRMSKDVAKLQGITAENYGRSADQYWKSLGKPPNAEVPVIREESAEWDEWMAYWDWLGVKWIQPQAIAAKRWTVPTYFPSDFDRRFSMTGKRTR